MSVRYRTFEMNWNHYLIKAIKAMRFLMRFKLTPKEDDKWILVEIRKSLILKVVSN